MALVGGPFDNTVGAAWAFVRKGATWIDQHKLIAPTTGPGREINVGGGGEFGSSVALASVGDTALVGGYRDNGYVGAAWVFIRKGTRWIDQHKLTAPTGGPGKELGAAYFGYSVAVSAFGGDTALVAGPNDGPNTTDLGAAWAFTRSGGAWTEQQKLTAPTSGADTELGHATVGDGVALSPDGTTALIGGLEDNTGVGAAWEFTFQPAFLKQPAVWVETQKLTAPAAGLGNEIGAGGFGWSVALSHGTSPTALIGGATDNNNVGAAWVFRFHQPPIK